MTNVNLEQHVGGDRSVVAAARISLGNEWAEWRGAKDEKLINFLMANHHGTPFEHNLFTFSIHAPIFVAREWMRHRIGSFNEKSGRYAEMEPDFYIPDHFREPSPSNKQGSVGHGEGVKSSMWCHDQHGIVYTANETCYNAYLELLSNGVAREQARMVLPLNMFTDFVWTVNARSLMHFLNLRRAENAQQEIRDYTPELEQLFNQEMPVTYEAWVKNGFVAP